MKTVKIVFLKKLFSDLKKALEWDDGKEKSCFLLCHSSAYKDKLKLLPHKMIVPQKRDYLKRSGGYCEVTKPFINKVFNEAIQTGSDVIQCHVHPFDPGQFSSFDLAEEPQFMKHIAQKIDGIHHASIVFGNTLTSLDSWYYDRKSDGLIAVTKVLVVGRKNLGIYVPHRSKFHDQGLPNFMDRSILAFGEEAMKYIGMLDVGVVGVSALGGPMTEFLARDNVNSILLCDPDKIEESNLNRLPGTQPMDIAKSKVGFYAKKIREINSCIEVDPFPASFYDSEIQRAFSQADIIFGCLDSGARLSVNRLALANIIPYFDFGAMIEVKDQRLTFAGGQVYCVIPGRSICLNCSGSFDSLLNEYRSVKNRKLDAEQGYIKGDINVPNPSVMFLDSVIAGLGYSEFLKYITRRLKSEIFKVYYDDIATKLIPSSCSEMGCIACRKGNYLGKGDKVPLMVPEEDAQIHPSG